MRKAKGIAARGCEDISPEPDVVLHAVIPATWEAEIRRIGV
jgi:hypothetical protein